MDRVKREREKRERVIGNKNNRIREGRMRHTTMPVRTLISIETSNKVLFTFYYLVYQLYLTGIDGFTLSNVEFFALTRRDSH